MKIGINILNGLIIGLSLSMAFQGCAKPKAPAVEPLVRDGSIKTPPGGSVPGVSDEDLRRQRILDEAREVFQTIYFPLDQSTLDAKSKSILSGVVRFMKEHGEVAFTASGHCDERGTEEYNLALGEKRAQAVTRYLADLGLPESRMRTVSYGEERPASEGHSESAWSLNRRTEFTPEFRF